MVLGVSLHELSEWGDVVAGLASLAVVGSIVLLWVQVRHQAQAGKVELVTGMTSLFVSVSQVFIDCPEMRKYFHGSEELPADVDKAEKARAIAVRLADAMDHVAAHLDVMEKDTAKAWKTYIKEIHGTSPVLKELLEKHGPWWPWLKAEVEGA